MKVLLIICGIISIGIGIYEIFWIKESSLAVVIMLISFIVAINSFAMARKK